VSSDIDWVHLSDFHVGKDNYAQRKLFLEICSHIGSTISSGRNLDCVFITGDVANKGQPDEYKYFFDDFIGPLLDVLGSNWIGNIFIVPGNHDVQRDRTRFFNRGDILTSVGELFDPTPRGRTQREQFFLRFSNYEDNDISRDKKWISSDSGTYSLECNIRSHTWRIVGVNTAWLSKDDLDRHFLTPGINITEDALGAPSTLPPLVLGHHPIDWMHDSEAAKLRSILSKHHAIYFHGHLHESDARYEGASADAQYFAVRCGAAFEARPDDRPVHPTGIMWGGIDLARQRIELQPFQWSARHREWQLCGDAFPNSNLLRPGLWGFPLPGTVATKAPVSPKKRTQPAVPPTAPRGWEVVDSKFLATRTGGESQENLLQFFDGRPPTWKMALSPTVPRREIVKGVTARFDGLETATKSSVVTILGAGGEGKSTAFLQVVAALVQAGWIILWRHNDLVSISVEQIRRVHDQHQKLVIAVDEAHSIADQIYSLAAGLGGTTPPHFLLCSRTIDWRAEARDLGKLAAVTDYQEITSRGITASDAQALVTAWNALGRDGMKNLYGQSVSQAAETLVASAHSLEVDEDEGALLGAMLRVRYGSRLKDKIRSILYRLKEIKAPGGSLLDTYALIAGMHAENLRFLSLPVIAEHLNITAGEAHRAIIGPLADETVAAGGGRFVLCRHKAIAEATVEILRETNLYGNLGEGFASLAGAAVASRKKGAFVPDLHKWDYELPKHFLTTERPFIAISIAERLLAGDPDDIRLRVNLSKIYRENKEPRKSVDLFRNYPGEINTRVAWHEWSVAERYNGDLQASIVVALASLCDQPQLPPVAKSTSQGIGTVAANLRESIRDYADKSVLPALMAAIRIYELVVLDKPDQTRVVVERAANEAAAAGGVPVPDDKLVSVLAHGVGAKTAGFDIESFLRHRLSRNQLLKLDGLSALVRRALS
jgi:hypothetical protein